MEIKGKQDKLRTKNPANPLRKEVERKKQLTYYVDLDSTLAIYNRWGSVGDIGEPVPDMKAWVLHWLKEGIKIKIFTVRACNKEAIPYIKKWLFMNGFPLDLEITNIKGIDCDMIFDNNAREVLANQGIIVDRIGEFSAALIRNRLMDEGEQNVE